MSQNKYKLPADVKTSAIGMVRGYPRRLAWYQAARDSIINGTPCNYVTYTQTIHEPAGVHEGKRDGSIFLMDQSLEIQQKTRPLGWKGWKTPLKQGG